MKPRVPAERVAAARVRLTHGISAEHLSAGQRLAGRRLSRETRAAPPRHWMSALEEPSRGEEVTLFAAAALNASDIARMISAEARAMLAAEIPDAARLFALRHRDVAINRPPADGPALITRISADRIACRDALLAPDMAEASVLAAVTAAVDDMSAPNA